MRPLDGFDTRPVGGTERAIGPFFSPENQWMGFFADGALHKVSVDGGIPLKLCDLGGTFRGASWGRDGTIVFAADAGLYRVSADGGQPEALTITTDLADLTLSSPQLLPDGATVLLGLLGDEGDRAGLLSLGTGAVKVLEELGAALTEAVNDIETRRVE